MIEMKCTINVMRLNHPKTITLPPPRPWKNCLPRNRSLVSKRLGAAALHNFPCYFNSLYMLKVIFSCCFLIAYMVG